MLSDDEKLVGQTVVGLLANDRERTSKAFVKNSMLENGDVEREVRIGKKKVATIYCHVERCLKVDVALEDTAQNILDRFTDAGISIEEILEDTETEE